MATTYLSPGVYVEEVPSASKPIEGVGTAVAAFVGFAEKGEFNKPVLIAWAPEDRFFKLRYAERMAEAFPDARLELIEDSYTFVSLDQPERTAELIAAFAREPSHRPDANLPV